MAAAVRFAADILAGVPSIVVGVFAYAIVVRPMHSYSALSAGVALAIIMIPIVARTAEESLRLVPNSMREAALALGITRWRAVVGVIIPGALTGIVTGIMLAVARIAGETAPLIFTALGSHSASRVSSSPSELAASDISLCPVALSGLAAAGLGRSFSPDTAGSGHKHPGALD